MSERDSRQPASDCPGCPDWRRLAAARDASPVEPPGWDEALRHLDGCAPCRTAAVAADPLLAFRRLPAPPLAADEAESMRLRVAALVGASRVSPSSSSWLGGRVARPRRLAAALPLRQHAAAAVVAAALRAGGNAPRGGEPAAATLPIQVLPNLASARALDAALAAQPVLDDLDRPFDHVVQWNGDDLSVVLVVDGRLGV